MRTTKTQKIQMIQNGNGRAEKVDGGYFFYDDSNGYYARIAKELFWELCAAENQRKLEDQEAENINQ